MEVVHGVRSATGSEKGVGVGGGEVGKFGEGDVADAGEGTEDKGKVGG